MKFNNDGLIPAIIQDSESKEVLMMAYMNESAYTQTVTTKKVTFYSRSKQRIWVKGETSGNFLHLVDLKIDCDEDALLIQVKPAGPACHKGTTTCWGTPALSTIDHLEKVIADRKRNISSDSYVSSLFKAGINKIAQKVGEEAV